MLLEDEVLDVRQTDIKQEVEMIYLTLDSPPRATKRRRSPRLKAIQPPQRVPLPPSSPQQISEASSYDRPLERRDVRVQEYLPEVEPRRPAGHTVCFVPEPMQLNVKREQEMHGKPSKMEQSQATRYNPRRCTYPAPQATCHSYSRTDGFV